jgi:hypothetical protein
MAGEGIGFRARGRGPQEGRVGAAFVPVVPGGPLGAGADLPVGGGGGGRLARGEGGWLLERALAGARRGREEDHPEDALSIYEARIEPLIQQTNNKAYKEAYELLLKVRSLMRRLGREQEFDEYLEVLRAEYKRKRNFMKLLDGIG